ncbi:MAG: sigma-70 family RNA polymerase sigma factor [Planctomycetes bacterium]|nr:sigma-70 family RNA polymerase sigma factor [Planctomycetota bacterium]
MDENEINRLVPLAQQGDHDAFQRLVEIIHYDVRVFVAVRCATDDLVEEVVQSALITSWRVLPKYEARGTFVSWVKGIALNHLRKELSNRARSAGRDLGTLLARHDAAALDAQIDQGEDPRLERLRVCMGRLSETLRTLIDLRYREDLDLDALAARLGRTAGALAVQFHRLRKTLRACVDIHEPTT